MKKSLLPLIAATLISGAAMAQISTSTTTGRDADGNLIREYTETKQYLPVTDAKIEANVGVVLPESVTLYELPATIKIEKPEQYRYVIINDKPVVVEKANRKIIHVWTK